MATQLQAHRLLARAFPTVTQAYTLRDTQLYALGVGLGSDPLDRGQLPYVYEGADGQSLRTTAVERGVVVLDHGCV